MKRFFSKIVIALAAMILFLPTSAVLGQATIEMFAKTTQADTTLSLCGQGQLIFSGELVIRDAGNLPLIFTDAPVIISGVEIINLPGYVADGQISLAGLGASAINLSAATGIIQPVSSDTFLIDINHGASVADSVVVPFSITVTVDTLLHDVSMPGGKLDIVFTGGWEKTVFPFGVLTESLSGSWLSREITNQSAVSLLSTSSAAMRDTVWVQQSMMSDMPLQGASIKLYQNLFPLNPAPSSNSLVPTIAGDSTIMLSVFAENYEFGHMHDWPGTANAAIFYRISDSLPVCFQQMPVISVARPGSIVGNIDTSRVRFVSASDTFLVLDFNPAQYDDVRDFSLWLDIASQDTSWMVGINSDDLFNDSLLHVAMSDLKAGLYNVDLNVFVKPFKFTATAIAAMGGDSVLTETVGQFLVFDQPADTTGGDTATSLYLPVLDGVEAWYSDGVISVDNSTGKPLSVKVMNLNGQEVESYEAQSGQTQRDISNLSEGVYVAIVTDASGKGAIKRFIR